MSFMNSGPEIEASYTTLFDQAKGTVSEYMSRAVTDLDNEFGEGYARKNPALVAAMVTAMGQDFTTAARSKAQQGMVEAVVNAITAITEAIEARDA